MTRRTVEEVKHVGIDDLVGSLYTWLRLPDNWAQKDKDTFHALQSKGLKVARDWQSKRCCLTCGLAVTINQPERSLRKGTGGRHIHV